MSFRTKSPIVCWTAAPAFLAAALALSSCVQATNSVSSSASTSLNFSTVASQTIDFGSSQTLSLTASGLYGKTLILAKINTGETTASAADTGSATLTSPTSSASVRSLRSTSSPLNLPPPRRPHPIASLQSNASSRTAASRAASSAFSASSRTTAVLYGETSPSYIEGTTTAQFWVDYYNTNGSLAGFDTITATLKKVTDHAYIWVAASNATDNAEASSTFDPSSESVLNSTKISLLADAFEAVVFPETTAIYGYERGGGTEGNGGIDADQHISILIYDIDFDAAISGASGYVAGYFWAKDDDTATVPTDDTYASGGVYPSNGREIFYLDAWALQNYPYTIASTLAHEYQHMINYNRVTYEGRTAASTWLDEFRSLATEDLLAPAFASFSATHTYTDVNAYSFNKDGPGIWAYYYSYYSNRYPYFGLNVWNQSLYDYSFASVFASYLLRAYGGIAFMSDAITQAEAASSANAAFISAVQSAAARSTATDGTAIASGAVSSFSSDFYAEILVPFSEALWGLGANGNSGAGPYNRTDAKAASATAASTRFLNAYTILDA
ncbi:MAG: hypothetical protein WCT14_21965, partial [Treponemataceae bacterium]